MTSLTELSSNLLKSLVDPTQGFRVCLSQCTDELSLVMWAKMSYGIMTIECDCQLKHPMEESPAISSTRQRNCCLFPLIAAMKASFHLTQVS